MTSPATRSASAPRRSGRERKQVESIYDEAANKQQEALSDVPKKKRGASKTRGR